MHTTVERELELRLVLSPDRVLAVPARLLYRTDDPYAVHITFHLGSQAPVHWTFARELLVEGVFRPSGHGDVRIWPTRDGEERMVCVGLSSPDGDALLQAPLVPVSAWLERTLRAVPPGTEADQIELEEELSALLAPSPGDRPNREETRTGDDGDGGEQ